LQVGERVVAQPLAIRLGADLWEAAAQLLAELAVIGLRHAEKVGNGEQGEGLGVVMEDFDGSTVDELIDLLVSELPQERFVLAHALWREESHDQRALGLVRRLIHRDEVFAHGHFVAMLRDEVVDVVARARVDREARQRSADRVAR
jgi:hypothetical protein